jgi:hypothetical protein
MDQSMESTEKYIHRQDERTEIFELRDTANSM